MAPVQLRPGINVWLTTTDPFLPTIAWTCNEPNCSWSSQLVPNTPPGQYFLFIYLYLAEIGAKDLTVNDIYCVFIIYDSYREFF